MAEVAAGQLELTGGFFPKSMKIENVVQLFLEAQQHKKYAQTTPLDDGVSSLFFMYLYVICFYSFQYITIKLSVSY
jgi:hypothetical protein